MIGRRNGFGDAARPAFNAKRLIGDGNHTALHVTVESGAIDIAAGCSMQAHL